MRKVVLALALSLTMLLGGCASLPFGNKSASNNPTLPTEADITATSEAPLVSLDDSTFQLVDPGESDEAAVPNAEPAPLEFDFSNDDAAANLEESPDELPLEGNNQLEAGSEIVAAGTATSTPPPVAEPVSEAIADPAPTPGPTPVPTPVIAPFESDEALPTTADSFPLALPMTVVAAGVLSCIWFHFRRRVS